MKRSVLWKSVHIAAMRRKTDHIVRCNETVHLVWCKRRRPASGIQNIIWTESGSVFLSFYKQIFWKLIARKKQPNYSPLPTAKCTEKSGEINWFNGSVQKFIAMLSISLKFIKLYSKVCNWKWKCKLKWAKNLQVLVKIEGCRPSLQEIGGRF